MKLSVRVGGVEKLIELVLEGEHCRFRFGDQPERNAQIVECEPGVLSLLLDGRSYEARVEAAEAELAVTVNGKRFDLIVRDPRRWNPKFAARGLDGRQNLTAVMPGKVVRVLVAEGDTVQAGQGIIVVEAMKMQNEMKALRNGRVVALHAREGATVAAGEVLASIE